MSLPRTARVARSQGMALFGILMILASLSLVAGTVYTVVQTNVAITGHHKLKQESFFQADAAIHYVQNRLSQDQHSGILNLDQPSVSFHYSPPSGYTFDPVTNLTRLANTNHFLLKVTGRSLGASTRIEAIMGRKYALGRIGVFGDKDLNIQPGFDVYSYDSDVVTNPTPSDSTGRAGVGSNEAVSAQPGITIDGSIFLGMSVDGTLATISGAGTIPLFWIPRVEPDPLGVIGGPLAESFAHYSIDGNNDNAAAGISGNTISLRAHQSYTMSSGYYYLDSFTLGNHAELILDSTADDPVVIFLSGDLTTQPSTVFTSSSGSPRGLYIFSNGTGRLDIQPNSEFRGFLYGPYADVDILPSGAAYGVFWGSDVQLQPGGDVFIDTRLLESFMAGTLEVVQWKEIR